jgi:hypothetical protein
MQMYAFELRGHSGGKFNMRKISSLALGLSLSIATGTFASAQDTPAAGALPNVLQITREYTKPGKGGAMHDKTESAFVQAMARAKEPAHYLALNSLSGKSRAIFLTWYASFDAWEKDINAVNKNAALSAELERANVADGELLDSADQAVFYFDPELSYRPHADISHARFMEVSEYHVKRGHESGWRELAKMVIAAHQKAGTSAHWAMLNLVFGGDGGTYLILSADKSMADIDHGFAEDKAFHDAMGDEGWKKFEQLYADTVDDSHNELFAINPKQSYMDESVIKEDPDFWKPTAAAPAKTRAASASAKSADKSKQ